MPPATPQSESPSPFLAPIPAIATPPSPWLSQDPESPEDHQLESDQLDARPFTTGSTDRAPGGDPVKVAQVIGGLFVVIVVSLSFLMRRTDRALRTPTPEQRDDVATPLARIACRHLPMDTLGPDAIDITEAVVAFHGYALDGPLITYADAPDVADVEVPEFMTEGPL